MELADPLFAVAEQDRADVATLILDLGVSPNVGDSNNERPLHRAPSTMRSPWPRFSWNGAPTWMRANRDITRRPSGGRRTATMPIWLRFSIGSVVTSRCCVLPDRSSVSASYLSMIRAWRGGEGARHRRGSAEGRCRSFTQEQGWSNSRGRSSPPRPAQGGRSTRYSRRLIVGPTHACGEPRHRRRAKGLRQVTLLIVLSARAAVPPPRATEPVSGPRQRIPPTPARCHASDGPGWSYRCRGQ